MAEEDLHAEMYLEINLYIHYISALSFMAIAFEMFQHIHECDKANWYINICAECFDLVN